MTFCSCGKLEVFGVLRGGGKLYDVDTDRGIDISMDRGADDVGER